MESTNNDSNVTSDQSSSGQSAAETFFMTTAHDQQLKVLFAMAVELPDNSHYTTTLQDIVQRSESLKQKDVNPIADHLVNEIIQRSQNLVTSKKINKVPRLKGWNNDAKISWLCDYPLDGDDKNWVSSQIESFLRDEEQKIQEAIDQRRAVGGNISSNNKAIMRLIEAYFLDELRPLMIKRNDSLGRQELDARNSTQRNISYFESVTSKFNDPSWTPYSCKFPNLHDELAVSFPLILPISSTTTAAATTTTAGQQQLLLGQQLLLHLVMALLWKIQ